MAFPQLIDFRNTSGFVTDPANAFAEIQPLGSGVTDYPTTSAQGNTVGWESGSSQFGGRDRNAAIDARLAGINFNITSPYQFRIDLPAAGTFNVNAAFGDASYAQSAFTAQFIDTTTVLSTPVNNVGTSASQHFIDATGVERTSAADWVSNNAAQSLTFSTTIFRAKFTAGVGAGVIAHLAIQSAGGGFTAKFRRTLSQVGTRVGSRQAQAA